jgi:hypothetical protein
LLTSRQKTWERFSSSFRLSASSKLSQIALLTTRTCLSRVPKPLVRLGGFLGVVSSGPSPTHLLVDSSRVDPHATLHHPQRIPFPREVEGRFVRSFVRWPSTVDNTPEAACAWLIFLSPGEESRSMTAFCILQRRGANVTAHAKPLPTLFLLAGRTPRLPKRVTDVPPWQDRGVVRRGDPEVSTVVVVVCCGCQCSFLVF